MSYDWDVIRTTTDKLAGELNDLAWDVHQIQFIGGRDWVIVCRQEVESDDERYKEVTGMNQTSEERFAGLREPRGTHIRRQDEEDYDAVADRMRRGGGR